MNAQTLLLEQTLAVSAVFQASLLITKVAYHQPLPDKGMRVILEALFTLEPAHFEDIYGNPDNLLLGLQGSGILWEKPMTRQDREAIWRMWRFISMGYSLHKNPRLSEALHKDLEDLQRVKAFESDLQSKIMMTRLSAIFEKHYAGNWLLLPISGYEAILDNEDNWHMIYALCLAGIRAAHLFFQVQGRSWDLFWHRRKFTRCARVILLEASLRVASSLVQQSHEDDAHNEDDHHDAPT